MNAKNIYDAFREIEEQRRIIEKYHKEIQRLNTQDKVCQERIKVFERALELACNNIIFSPLDKDYFISQAEKEKKDE